MKNFALLWVCLLTFQFSIAQQAAQATEEVQENYSLRERYGIMKAKSQSFKEYKVIKESVLDGVWKITRDSLLAKDVALRDAKKNINALNAKLNQSQETIKQKEESMAETLHASTHIAVLGIDIPKGVFLTLVTAIVGGLVFLLVTIFGRMKLLAKSLQEKKLTVNMITNEYEEYKRKAMEKQTKLSRELQDERNRLQAIRNS